MYDIPNIEATRALRQKRSGGTLGGVLKAMMLQWEEARHEATGQVVRASQTQRMGWVLQRGGETVECATMFELFRETREPQPMTGWTIAARD
jgi:hypothetical protein